MTKTHVTRSSMLSTRKRTVRTLFNICHPPTPNMKLKKHKSSEDIDDGESSEDIDDESESPEFEPVVGERTHNKRKKQRTEDFSVGDTVETKWGPAIIWKMYPDGDVDLVWKNTPGKQYSLSMDEIWVKKTKTNSYTKRNTATKQAQNSKFIQHLRELKPLNKVKVFILDTGNCFSTAACVAAGIRPSRIYIPQPDHDEAARIKQKYPTVKVYPGYKAGELVFALAGKTRAFDGFMLDYCGMPGNPGQKNSPMDDISNIAKYDLLSDSAVVTQTVCARSCKRVNKKHENLYNLIQHTKGSISHKISNMKTNIYKDKGSQTMCNVQYILRSV